MTREEHISNLETIGCDGWTVTTEAYKSLQFAIQTLEQEPCEDCISRVEAIKAVREAYSIYISRMNGWEKGLPLKIDKAIYDLPSIQPKPMQVDLEGDGYADGELVYDYGKCPKCGWDFEYGDKDWEEPYCCHCGQKLHWFESEDKE